MSIRDAMRPPEGPPPATPSFTPAAQPLHLAPGQAPTPPARDPAAGPVNHDLRTWPEPFRAVRAGTKRHEYRRDDRGFLVGDTLTLLEWDPETKGYTGESEFVLVTYVSRGPGWGIPAGYVCMTIAPVTEG